MQALLFPDPRPLVERLGRDFFRQLPECPGVYLMRDSADAVLYVGKAKNLRKRLCSYRVANPDRLPQRHLRLLRSVARIDLQECMDERAALARESELLLALRPRFNRAGTWPGKTRFLLWRTSSETVELAVADTVDAEWRSVGPLGAGAEVVRAALVRLLWCAINPDLAIAAMPHSWFWGRHGGLTVLRAQQPEIAGWHLLPQRLGACFDGDAEPFARWELEQASIRTHPFEAAVCEADLETVLTFAKKQRERGTSPLSPSNPQNQSLMTGNARANLSWGL